MKDTQSQWTTRDISIKTYENGLRTNYLLVAAISILLGRDFIGSPPLVVASFLLTIAAIVFTLAVVIRARAHLSRRLIYVLLSLLVLASLALPYYLGIDGLLGDAISVSRIVFAVALFWYALSLPLVPKEVEDADGP
jgi:hypothetical protein